MRPENAAVGCLSELGWACVTLRFEPGRRAGVCSEYILNSMHSCGCRFGYVEPTESKQVECIMSSKNAPIYNITL